MSAAASSSLSVMGMDMSGKRVLVTGGSKGIGLACAQLFIELGAEVTICARGLPDLESAKKSMKAPERCEIMVADLSSETGIKEFVQAFPHQELHALINNAGHNIRKKAEDFTMKEFESIFSLNFFSAYQLSVAFLPHLRRAGDGSLVNIGSVAGNTHIPSGLAYGASKAAMEQMTRNLSVEWARFGIRVNCVAPGPISTPLLAGAPEIYKNDFKKRIPMGRFGDPMEVARPVAFFASQASSYVTGQLLYVEGGFCATSFNEVPSYWEKGDESEEAPSAERATIGD